MAFDTGEGRNEGQVRFTPTGLSNFQKIFGIDCKECFNKGCDWCKSTEDSVYNKRLENNLAQAARIEAEKEYGFHKNHGVPSSG